MKSLLPLLLFAVSSCQAQFAIHWSTLDGGGGQSSGGAYTLAGTLGSPAAGASSGGAYTLQGGFWSAFVSVPTEGEPLLRISQLGPNIVLAWPNPSPGFQLQESPSLSAPSWTDINVTPGVVGSEKQVSLPLAPGTRFYRLRQP